MTPPRVAGAQRQSAAPYPRLRGVRLCGRQAAGTPDGTWYYGCTRPDGHTGPHVAHVLDGAVVACWEDAAAEEEGVTAHA
jgi:hypothetical protein